MISLPQDITALILQYLEAKEPDVAIAEIVAWGRVVRQNYIEDGRLGRDTDMSILCPVLPRRTILPFLHRPIVLRWCCQIVLTIRERNCMISVCWDHYDEHNYCIAFGRDYGFEDVKKFRLIEYTPREIPDLPPLMTRPQSYRFEGFSVPGLRVFRNPPEDIDDKIRQDMTSNRTFYSAFEMAAHVHR